MLAAQVTVPQDGPPPAHEAQVDYGMLGMWWGPTRQVRRRVWAFVMVLAASRQMFVRPLLVMYRRAWNDMHVAAFAFFGGVTEQIVPEGLKTGVQRPDLYDPKVNRSSTELDAHYGLLIDPARVFKSKDKARVERPMPCVRTVSGAAASSAAWSRCRATLCAGALRSLAGGPAGRWVARPRRWCSPRPSSICCGRCQCGRSSSRAGPG